MTRRYAVIDLGTNTFHLLIFEFDEHGHITDRFRERVFVKLAEGGINTIAPAPFQRGLEAINQFQKTLLDYSVSEVKAFGTAALRTAGNAPLFVADIKTQTGIEVDIISGQEEARLIYLGVNQFIDFDHRHDLIMDIGGGSVEFIIANRNGISWSASFPLGVAVLYNEFHHSDPISAQEIERLQNHLSSTLNSLAKAVEQFPVNRLIGASGTFDVLEDNLTISAETPAPVSIPVQQFFPFHQYILGLSQSQRQALDNIPSTRADMIVVALLLIEHIISLTAIREIIVSPFAMKEGMIHEMIQHAISEDDKRL